MDKCDSSTLSGAPILKISSCFNDACSKKDSALHSSSRNTSSSISSEETISSSDLASARSSCTSSGYSGMSSLCECFEVQIEPSHFVRRQRGSIIKLFGEAELPSGTTDSKETPSLGSQPSLKMIRRLKRLSDAWSNVSKCTDDIIIDRLKKGREEAIKKQTYIEELLNEASSQYCIQRQAQALLHICSDENPIDEVEAERIVLLAGERYKAYHQEAERIVTDLGPTTWEAITQSTLNKGNHSPATLYISDIKLNLTEKFKNHLQSSPKTHPHHFMCLLKEKKTEGIIATQIISTESSRTSPVLHFSNLLTLPEIPPDFILTIEVYHMGNNDTRNVKKTKLSRALSTVKRVPSIRRYRYLSCTSDVTDESSTTTKTVAATALQAPSRDKEEAIHSNFLYAGKVTLTRQELFSSAAHEICDGGIASTVDLAVTADPLYLHSGLEGYLNAFQSKWERWWFVLNESESTLKCWQYHDQAQQKERPLFEWPIENCHKLACSSSSETCTWRHSFVLPLAGNKDAQELQLAAHSSEQEHQWLAALNSIIQSNLEWYQQCIHS